MNLEGIGVRLGGSSQYGVGCVCETNRRQWVTRANDLLRTTKCTRCGQIWHQCAAHGTVVRGDGIEAISRSSNDCTCQKPWMPPVSGCLKCGSSRFEEPHETFSTKVCSNCFSVYHVCPMDGRAVEGPGYPLSAREQTMCQCHENLPFLGKSWTQPYA